jgi:hypothetical protein
MEAPKKFPFAPAKSPRRVFPQVDPDKTAAAKRAHDVRGLDFFLLLVLHELGHGLANKLCGRACSIQIEKSGFAYTCHDPAHKLDQADEIFVAAIGGSVHLAFVLALPAVTPRFLQQYVAHAINRDAQLAGVRPEFLHALIQNEVLPHIFGTLHREHDAICRGGRQRQQEESGSLPLRCDRRREEVDAGSIPGSHSNQKGHKRAHCCLKGTNAAESMSEAPFGPTDSILFALGKLLRTAGVLR